MTKKYLLNPFNVLYQDDILLSQRPEILGLKGYAQDLEELIEGDFDLEFLTSEFASNQLGFVRNGLLLAKIKFLRLYKNHGDGTFASFCCQQLKKQRWQINDTIRAARIVLELIYAGFETLPTNISQALALAKLTGETLVEKWRSIINILSGEQITAHKIRHLISPSEKEKSATIKVPPKIHEDIHREAAERGLSIATFLRTILEFFLTGDAMGIDIKDLKSGIEGGNSHLWNHQQNITDYAEKERIWEEDLANLVKENQNVPH